MNKGIHSSFVLGIAWFMGWLAMGAALAGERIGQDGPEGASPEPGAISASQRAPSESGSNISYELRADVFMVRKSYPEALEYYQLALKDPGSNRAVLWNKIGIAHQNLHNYRAARNAYRKAIKIQKGFPEPWNNCGTTYYLEKQPKKSLKWYRKAIELSPRTSSFHYNLGTALYASKQIPQAIDSYRTALILDPDHFANRSRFGTTMQARPADAGYYFYMAKVFASLGRREDAVRFLRRALEDGFKNLEMLDRDPDFAKFAEYPPYLELRANPPRPL